MARHKRWGTKDNSFAQCLWITAKMLSIPLWGLQRRLWNLLQMLAFLQGCWEIELSSLNIFTWTLYYPESDHWSFQHNIINKNLQQLSRVSCKRLSHICHGLKIGPFLHSANVLLLNFSLSPFQIPFKAKLIQLLSQWKSMADCVIVVPLLDCLILKRGRIGQYIYPDPIPFTFWEMRLCFPFPFTQHNSIISVASFIHFSHIGAKQEIKISNIAAQ